MPHIIETIKVENPIRKIRQEAERRITTGILVNGAPFQCDDASTQRVGELVGAFRDTLVGDAGVSFRTRNGQAITLTSEVQATTLFDAQRQYRANCMAASAILQGNPPADPTHDAHWPARPTVTL